MDYSLDEARKSFLNGLRDHGYRRFNLEHRVLNAKCDEEDRLGLLPEEMKYSRPVGKTPKGIVDMKYGKVKESIFVLDWDDTLLPTSYLNSRTDGITKVETVSEKLRSQLQTLDECTVKFLSMLIHLCSNVLIITNGMEGWVQKSSKLFLPNVHEFLFSKDGEGKGKVKVLSARVHERRHPTKSGKWKKLEFKYQLNQIIPEEYLPQLSEDSITLSPMSQSIEYEFVDVPKIKPKKEEISSQIDFSTVFQMDDEGFETIEEEFIEGLEDRSQTRKRKREEDVDCYPTKHQKIDDSENKTSLLSIISMGDNWHDLTALTKYQCLDSRCVKKTIKVKFMPRPEELLDMQTNLMIILTRLISFNGAVSLEFKEAGRTHKHRHF
eukprot:snap_masked-scaffold_12-processed-gene-6.12-mRNA-1 protein AED:1.00 eAED:1.00 QI:0/-1/0/0/-1/1/1/0/379